MVEDVRSSNSEVQKDLLVFTIAREITNLSKTFLVLLEDLRDIDQTIDTEQYIRFRARILDNFNGSIRNLTKFLERYDVKLKN